MSDTQVFVALAVALIPGLLHYAYRQNYTNNRCSRSKLADLIDRPLTNFTCNMVTWEMVLTISQFCVFLYVVTISSG